MKRSAELLQRVRAGLIWLVLLPIRAYSRLISPLFPRRCKYYPTCSAYAQEAIRTHGVIRGGAPGRMEDRALQSLQPRRRR